MTRSVAVLSRDAEIRRMLTVSLRKAGIEAVENGVAGCVLAVVDLDTCRPPENVPCVGFSRAAETDADGAVFHRPFSTDELIAYIRRRLADSAAGDTNGFRFDENARTAYLHGENVPLSVAEASLLSALCRARGEAVSRDALLSEVFPDAGESALNVYVHYLRRKLESDGVKRLFSVRGRGYAFRP